jgi:hypothetical protein
MAMGFGGMGGFGNYNPQDDYIRRQMMDYARQQHQYNDAYKQLTQGATSSEPESKLDVKLLLIGD